MFPARIPIISSPPSGFQNTSSLAFDGIDDYVSVSSSFNVTGANLSISFWILQSGDISSTKYIMGKTPASGNDIEFSILYGWANYLVFRKDDGSNGKEERGFSVTDLDDGNWHHFLFTLAGTDFNCWQNNIQRETDYAFPSSGITESGFELRFADNRRYSYNANIMLDEIAIFNTDKSSVHSDIYNDGVPSDLSGESGLIGYWRFEEGSGTTAIDETGNNNGTLVNDPAYSTDVPPN